MSTKSLAFAAIAAVAAMSASVGTANAGHRGFSFHAHHGIHGHHFRYRPRLYVHVGPSYGSCAFYREMWHDTGLFKWKRRYYSCKGWW